MGSRVQEKWREQTRYDKTGSKALGCQRLAPTPAKAFRVFTSVCAGDSYLVIISLLPLSSSQSLPDGRQEA